MGVKLYADTATKTLVVTLAPDGNDRVTVNTQIDIWSDLIEDWESTLALRRFTFPVTAIGGQTISTGKLGTSYVLLDPWAIAPYEADHEFVIDGNLATELETATLVLPTVGGYTVAAKEKVSTLVEVVETGISGLTTAESDALILVGDVEGGRWEIDAVAMQMVYYKPDNITEVMRFDLLDSDGNPTGVPADAFERVRA